MTSRSVLGPGNKWSTFLNTNSLWFLFVCAFVCGGGGGGECLSFRVLSVACLGRTVLYVCIDYHI